MALDLKGTRAVAAITAALVAGLLAGGTAGWLLRSADLRDLEKRLDAAETRLAEIAQAQADTTTSPGPTGEGEKAADVTATTPPEEPAEPLVERQPALVTAVRSIGSTHYLTLDYVQFLTGAEAAAAAAAHGDESPPPNDYYVVNDNPRLREFPVQRGITVRVVSRPDGTVTPAGYDMPLAEWVARLTGPDSRWFLGHLYWVTITDGTITAIEQQYLP